MREKAILVGLEALDELRELATAAGAMVVGEVIQHRIRPDPAYFIGRGKAAELREDVLLHDADLVVFDEDLSPAQMRNLEKLLEIKVIDRTGLILDIFSRRARTREGQLQVELAQLNYRLAHLAGGAAWLSRLGGGIGARGPGETQLEVDRRRVRDRIARLNREVEQIRQRRRLHRERRQRNALPTIALVGYTNAGKSTLFERLSGQSTLTSGRMFSTLDTLVRRVRLDPDQEVLLSDTVGFIRKLPHALVKAFRATLEEVSASDLVLHVVDASDPARAEKMEVVQRVLAEIGCDRPQLTVFNKMDQVSALEAPPDGFPISALSGEGVDTLKAAMARDLARAASN